MTLNRFKSKLTDFQQYNWQKCSIDLIKLLLTGGSAVAAQELLEYYDFSEEDADLLAASVIASVTGIIHVMETLALRGHLCTAILGTSFNIITTYFLYYGTHAALIKILNKMIDDDIDKIIDPTSNALSAFIGAAYTTFVGGFIRKKQSQHTQVIKSRFLKEQTRQTSGEYDPLLHDDKNLLSFKPLDEVTDEQTNDYSPI